MTTASAESALAWGFKGHSIASEAATHAVPYEMPAFFHDAYPGLVYLGYDPDRWRGAGESLDVAEKDHFLDYEYVEPLGPLPPSRLAFIDLISSGLRRSLGIDIDTTGFVPWRVAELCELLTRQWQLWQDSTHPIEKRQIEQNIIHLSGILGHYVADSANPHHSTKEYNGWTSPNPNGYRTDCETHSRFGRRGGRTARRGGHRRTSGPLCGPGRPVRPRAGRPAARAPERLDRHAPTRTGERTGSRPRCEFEWARLSPSRK